MMSAVATVCPGTESLLEFRKLCCAKFGDYMGQTVALVLPTVVMTAELPALGPVILFSLPIEVVLGMVTVGVE